MAFTIRLATLADLPALQALMAASIRQLQTPFLSPEEIDASFDIMGLDRQLIDDGTYFAVEEDGRLIGCGGWSRRATLFGGSHSLGRDDALLDPDNDPARIRAMYTHPDAARRGVGRLVLETCEAAARQHGFQVAELVGTLAGRPLYEACGYSVVAEMRAETQTGPAIPVCRMTRNL